MDARSPRLKPHVDLSKPHTCYQDFVYAFRSGSKARLGLPRFGRVRAATFAASLLENRINHFFYFDRRPPSRPEEPLRFPGSQTQPNKYIMGLMKNQKIVHSLAISEYLGQEFGYLSRFVDLD